MTPATKLHSPDSPTTHSVNSLPLSPSPALAPRPTTPPPLASSPDVATAPSDSLLALPDRNSPPRAASPDAASSSPLSLSSSTSSSSPSASTPANANATPPPRRVKLYRLQEDQWIDLGTGNCVGIFIDPAVPGSLAPDEGAWIVVSKEPSPTNSDSVDVDVLLRSRIESAGTQLDDEEDSYDDAEKACNFGAYQKQQDTLIVWTDKLTEMEMALSFATNSGCAEIWSFIKHARKWQADQMHRSPSLSPGLLSPQPFPYYGSIVTRLPELTLSTIPQLEHAIRSLGRSAVGRERTASAIIKGEYIQKLIKIQIEAEDLESIDDLHALCRVMQTILLLNDNSTFDLILKDEIILGVASVLEYDPEFPTMKASYRSHLADPSHFTQVVPIRSPALLAKIHQTHRLHYLKNVVLARILEDSTFSMLNSAIYFNEVDIVNEVANDGEFLRELFAIFDSEEGVGSISEEGIIGPQLPTSTTTIGPSIPSAPPTVDDSAGAASMEIDPSLLAIPDSTSSSSLANGAQGPPSSPATDALPSDKRHDAILFLQQFCSMAKNLQLPLRAAFFRNLVEKGLLRVIEVALSLTVEKEDSVMKAATVEILMNLVDHDPNNVRGYSLKQQVAGKRPLVLFLVELFHREKDLGLKAQMSEALRVLVDAGGEGGPLEAPPRMRQEDPEAEKFLQYFYDHCILPLLAPILDLPDLIATDPPLSLSLHDIALTGHLCDLLCFFVTHHTFRSKYFVLSSPIALNVAKLFPTKHKHLRLAALRFFRACVGKNDDFYNRFLIKNGLFGGVLEMMEGERTKDNLLASACLEFFEHIRAHNAKAVINHLMDRFGDRVRSLAALLPTFANLILRSEQNNEPPPPPATAATDSSTTGLTSKSMTRERGSWSRMEMEEESYFNSPDDEEDDDPLSLGNIIGPLRANATSGPSRKRESDIDEVGRKKAKLAESEGGGSGGASASQSRGGGRKGKGKSLVDYGDDSDEEISPGGFIREDVISIDAVASSALTSDPIALGTVPTKSSNGTTTTSEEESISSSLVSTTPPPPQSEPPPRRKAEEEDDQLGLLSASSKCKKSPFLPSVATSFTPSNASTPDSNVRTLKLGTTAIAMPRPMPKPIVGLKISLAAKSSLWSAPESTKGEPEKSEVEELVEERETKNGEKK